MVFPLSGLQVPDLEIGPAKNDRAAVGPPQVWRLIIELFGGVND